jgi:hypothetical protein
MADNYGHTDRQSFAFRFIKDRIQEYYLSGQPVRYIVQFSYSGDPNPVNFPQVNERNAFGSKIRNRVLNMLFSVINNPVQINNIMVGTNIIRITKTKFGFSRDQHPSDIFSRMIKEKIRQFNIIVNQVLNGQMLRISVNFLVSNPLDYNNLEMNVPLLFNGDQLLEDEESDEDL